MDSKKLLFSLYKKFYDQRQILKAAPHLTLVPENPEQFNYGIARREMNAMISYLAGVSDIENVEFYEALDLVVRNYDTQPFWKSLILDWFDFLVVEEREMIQQDEKKLKRQIEDVLNVIDTDMVLRSYFVENMAKQIKAAGFHVDGRKLAANFLKMYQQDPKSAKKTLETNPAFFAPIQTQSASGETVLTPDAAVKENKKLASFLGKIKIGA